MFFPLSTIKKFHVEIVFVAWLRDLSWEVKIVCLFLLESTSRKFLILLLFHLPVFYCKYRLHLLLFSLIVMAFPACTCKPGPRCVGLQHDFLCFLLFLNLYFYSLSCIITHVCFLIPSARSLRFESRLWKVNIDPNWNLFYHYLFQRTPVIYNFISQENVILFGIYFH